MGKTEVYKILTNVICTGNVNHTGTIPANIPPSSRLEFSSEPMSV